MDSGVASFEGSSRELAPHHREQFYAIGISDEFIAAAGIYSLRDGREISRILKWKRPIPDRWCVAFPYFTLGGEQYGTVLRPDVPIRTGRKYEWPSGVAKRPYLPPPGLVWPSAWSDPVQPIVVTEGIKKALAVLQVGYLCISLEGVETFHDVELRHATGVLQLHADLLALPWRGRAVYVGYDSPDTQTKPGVIRGESRLVWLLNRLGAEVRLLRLPVAGLGKSGLDDFLAGQADPVGAFNELLALAVLPDLAACERYVGAASKRVSVDAEVERCPHPVREVIPGRRASVVAACSLTPVPLPGGLPEDIVDLIRRGHRAGGPRHPQDLRVVLALVEAGCSDDEIADIFRTHPIGAKLRENGVSYLSLTVSKARGWWEAESSAEIREVYLDRGIYVDNVGPSAGKGPGKRIGLNGTDSSTGRVWSHRLSWPDAYRSTEDHVRALFASAGLTISDFSNPSAVFRLSKRTIRVAEFWPTECRVMQTRFLPAISPTKLL